MNRVEYELFYLVGESKEAELPKIREEVEKIVKRHSGEFLPAETSEKRTMAYEIRKEKRGTYVARRFTLPGASDEPFVEEVEPKLNAIEEITREMRLFSDVLRFLILRADNLPELSPISREESPMRERRGTTGGSRDRRGPDQRVARLERVMGAAPTERDLKLVPEKKVTAPVESVKESTKEEIDKKLDEVLSGIE